MYSPAGSGSRPFAERGELFTFFRFMKLHAEEYKVKKDYGSGQRSSYYGFRKDFPEGGRKGRFRKSASRSERGKRIAKIALMVLGFAAVMVLAFYYRFCFEFIQ